MDPSGDIPTPMGPFGSAGCFPSQRIVREKQRRNRKINSCLQCRRRKIRCTRTEPCDPCQRLHKECTYLSAKPVLLASNAVSTSTTSSIPEVNGTGRLDEPSADSEPSLLNTPGNDATDSSRKQSETTDICLRIGKLSCTERIGGMRRLDLIGKVGSIPYFHAISNLNVRGARNPSGE